MRTIFPIGLTGLGCTPPAKGGAGGLKYGKKCSIYSQFFQLGWGKSGVNKRFGRPFGHWPSSVYKK